MALLERISLGLIVYKGHHEVDYVFLSSANVLTNNSCHQTSIAITLNFCFIAFSHRVVENAKRFFTF